MSSVAPGKPEQVRVDSVGATWVYLLWRKPTEEGLPALTEYLITIVNTNHNEIMTYVTATTNDTKINITNLLPKIRYEFFVQSVNILLNSLFTSPVVATTNISGK